MARSDTKGNRSRPKRGDNAKPGKAALGWRRRSSRDLVNHSLMHALAKSARVRIFAIFCERVACPKEIADELNEGLSQVSYHVKVLHSCGLIVEDHQVPRRGAVAHFYRATVPTLIPPEAWNNLPPAVRKSISMGILQEFFDDASASMEAELFDDPPGELSWTPLILDSLGLEQVGQLARDFLNSVLEAQVETNKRLADVGKKGTGDEVSATVFLASFLSARSPNEGKKAPATTRR